MSTFPQPFFHSHGVCEWAFVIMVWIIFLHGLHSFVSEVFTLVFSSLLMITSSFEKSIVTLQFSFCCTTVSGSNIYSNWLSISTVCCTIGISLSDERLSLSEFSAKCIGSSPVRKTMKTQAVEKKILKNTKYLRLRIWD